MYIVCLFESDFMFYLSFDADCGNTTTIANAVIDFSNMKTTYRRTVPVTCRTGYEIVGRNFIECESNGSWSTTTTCEIIGMNL